jgi:hypothetical protein
MIIGWCIIGTIFLGLHLFFWLILVDSWPDNWLKYSLFIPLAPLILLIIGFIVEIFCIICSEFKNS